jgi:hypothetical protein
VKLKVVCFDFGNLDLTFRIPRDIMESRAWGAGEADVDIDAISQTLEDRAAGQVEVAPSASTNTGSMPLPPIHIVVKACNVTQHDYQSAGHVMDRARCAYEFIRNWQQQHVVR